MFAERGRAAVSLLCQAFADSIAGVVGGGDAASFAHRAAAVLAMVCRQAAEECPVAGFDVDVVRLILCRVHADATQEPLDFVAGKVKRLVMAGPLRGSCLLAVFGELACASPSADCLAQDAKPAAVPALEEVCGSSHLRPEHLWLLLAGEVARAASARMPAAGAERLRHRIVELVHSQLLQLMAAYGRHEDDARRLEEDRASEGLWREDVPRPIKGALSVPEQSNLLVGLTPEGARNIVRVCVHHGVVAHVDSTVPTQRTALPLHLEMFQALLLQALARLEQGPSQSDAASVASALPNPETVRVHGFQLSALCDHAACIWYGCQLHAEWAMVGSVLSSNATHALFVCSVDQAA